MKVQLKDIAHGRCGDKSDTSNICIYAREPKYYKAMAEQLTPERVRRHFEGLVLAMSHVMMCRNWMGLILSCIMLLMVVLLVHYV